MDIAQLFGGADMGDIKKAVGFILDNSDELQKVLKLAKTLPDDGLDLLKTVGTGLAEAGEQAARAAASLVGENGEGGAKQALSSGADTMTSAKDKLGGAAGMLAGLAKDLDRIPAVGDAAAKKLNDGSGMIGGVADELENLAATMRDLSGILTNVGEALNGLGGKLSESGGSVKTLVGA